VDVCTLQLGQGAPEGEGINFLAEGEVVTFPPPTRLLLTPLLLLLLLLLIVVFEVLSPLLILLLLVEATGEGSFLDVEDKAVLEDEELSVIYGCSNTESVSLVLQDISISGLGVILDLALTLVLLLLELKELTFVGEFLLIRLAILAAEALLITIIEGEDIAEIKGALDLFGLTLGFLETEGETCSSFETRDKVIDRGEGETAEMLEKMIDAEAIEAEVEAEDIEELEVPLEQAIAVE